MSLAAAAAAKSLQSCPTLCDPIDGSPPSSPVLEILQARTLVWVAISFSNGWKWKVKVKSFGRVWLLANLRTAAYQAPPSMGFSRQEYWSGGAIAFSDMSLKTHLNWWFPLFICNLLKTLDDSLCRVSSMFPVIWYLDLDKWLDQMQAWVFSKTTS